MTTVSASFSPSVPMSTNQFLDQPPKLDLRKRESVILPEDIRAEPVSGALGAWVAGVDFSAPLSSSRAELIRALLVKYQVLFFRDQKITPQQHVDFSAKFGALDKHPVFPHVPNHPEVMLLETKSGERYPVDTWHSDLSFQKEPVMGTILLARTVPPYGGDTMFSSMSCAFDALSDKMQSFLSTLQAQHSFLQGYKESLEKTGGAKKHWRTIRDNPPVNHPVIRTHPETGKKGIFVNPLFTSHIVGMTLRESRSLLDFLFTHTQSAEFTTQLRWSSGTVAFWDNRLTQHKPTGGFFPEARLMHRVTLLGGPV